MTRSPTLAIGFNANAATVTLYGELDDYTTVIVDDPSLQSGSAGSGNQIDQILAYTLLGNSGDATEIDWMTTTLDHLGVSYDPISSIQKLEFDTDADSDSYWKTDDSSSGVYTGDLDSGASHYLIKIGQGNVSYVTFLYKNLEDLFLASIDLGWLEDFSGFTEDKNFDIYRISHVSAVPVPATFWLFGTALVGFIGISRRTNVS